MTPTTTKADAPEGTSAGQAAPIWWCVRNSAMRGKPDSACGWFHFWDRNTYGEPQFGDAYQAKRYKNLAGSEARCRALRRLGYFVHSVARTAPTQPTKD